MSCCPINVANAARAADLDFDPIRRNQLKVERFSLSMIFSENRLPPRAKRSRIVGARAFALAQ